MAVTVSGTGITFNDATVQTSKASVVSGTAYSGYTAYYTTGQYYVQWNEYSVARAISALGGSDLLCAIEFGYITLTYSDGTVTAQQYRARRLYRTVS